MSDGTSMTAHAVLAALLPHIEAGEFCSEMPRPWEVERVDEWTGPGTPHVWRLCAGDAVFSDLPHTLDGPAIVAYVNAIGGSAPTCPDASDELAPPSWGAVGLIMRELDACKAEAARWRERCRMTGADVVALGITTDDLRAWLTATGWAPTKDASGRCGRLADGYCSTLTIWRSVPRTIIGVRVPDTDACEDVAAAIRTMGQHLSRSPWAIADDIVAMRPGAPEKRPTGVHVPAETIERLTAKADEALRLSADDYRSERSRAEFSGISTGIVIALDMIGADP